MGQYHVLVNIDRQEYVHPHAIGSGLKQWEQIHTEPSTPHALFALLCCSNWRGGGDLGEEDDQVYAAVMGRWAGDRVLVVGDYAKPGDAGGLEGVEEIYGEICAEHSPWVDISPLVRDFFEAEFGILYKSLKGWAEWTWGPRRDYEETVYMMRFLQARGFELNPPPGWRGEARLLGRADGPALRPDMLIVCPPDGEE